MPSQARVLSLIRAGMSYAEIGKRLQIRPGLAYLIGTGLPADGSDVPAAEDVVGRAGVLPGSTQHLANPPTHLPKHSDSVEQWLRRRAHLDAPMQAAAKARTAEPPPLRDTDSSDDVIDVLGRRHNQVKVLLEQLQAIPGVRQGGSAAQQDQRRSLVDMITVRLSQHESAEEGHLWPAVRSVLPDGDALADRALEQEREGKDLLHELGRLSGREDRFDELVEQLVAALRQHVAFEDLVFLKLREQMPQADRAELGRTVRSAHEHGPTRPHPHAPEEGFAARVAAATAHPMDSMRDALGDRPAKRRGRVEADADNNRQEGAAR
jgi:hemerythrin-like domain-containing protein